MPYSADEGKPFVVEKLMNIHPNYVLDVGAGAGVYGKLVNYYLPETRVDAVEIFQPYVERFNLKDIYRHVFVEDVREITATYFGQYDVIIFGDVLEHMTKEDALEVWDRAIASDPKAVILSIPIVHYPQGHSEGNPYEEHVKDDWSHEEVMESFSFISDFRVFDIVGVYVAERMEWN